MLGAVVAKDTLAMVGNLAHTACRLGPLIAISGSRRFAWPGSRPECSEGLRSWVNC
jgi:hypothetical protein